MISVGSMVPESGKREGYAVPGVEVKLSARLSAGECSNLICGEFSNWTCAADDMANC